METEDGPISSGKTQQQEKGLSSSPIVIDETSPYPDYGINCNIDDETTITLYAESKKRTLQSNYWLADSEIHAGKKRIKKQHPFISGFHSPSIWGDLVMPEPSEFIQIKNTSGSHWVWLSTIGSPSGTVKLYNSIRSSCPNKVVLEHASRMLFTKEQSITFVIPPVQEQIGPNDCGLFALAFATSLCQGMPPEEREYDQALTRRHYVDCLEQLAIKPFPGCQRLLILNEKMVVYEVKVFCSCRMPDDGKKYIECSRCQEWYHPACENIPTSAMKKKSKWYCSTCQRSEPAWTENNQHE